MGLDREGYNRGGFNKYGYNRKGYNKFGFNKFEIDKDGFNTSGFDKDGYNRDGYNEQGYNRDGFNINGYDKLGYDRDGFDITGYNKDGYDKLGFSKDGYDKEGYAKDGYNVRGFDRNGFDRQGYNMKGEYFEYIEKYLRENTEIKVKNKTLIYSEEIKDVFIDIEIAKKTMIIEDYIATISHLRRCGEKFATEVLMSSGILPYKFMNLNQYDKIKLVQQEKLLSYGAVKLLDKIRDNGNGAVHEGQADKKVAEEFLSNMQAEVHNWISSKNN